MRRAALVAFPGMPIAGMSGSIVCRSTPPGTHPSTRTPRGHPPWARYGRDAQGRFRNYLGAALGVAGRIGRGHFAGEPDEG